jgi:hypothetical protein
MYANVSQNEVESTMGAKGVIYTVLKNDLNS